MDAPKNNPTTNTLPKGVTQDDILDAVRQSGYPLQLEVANELRTIFDVYEEWAFVDADTGCPRTLDLFCERSLVKPGSDSPQVRPTLNLLIECKRSELPYVFFTTEIPFRSNVFPCIAGLPHEEIKVSTDDTRSTFIVNIQDALGLCDQQFVSNPAVRAAIFSKCTRKGKNLSLSGEEPFNALIHPLLKALHHFKCQEAPAKRHVHFDCHLAFAIAVIDAPLVAVRCGASSETTTLEPWIRIQRHRGTDNHEPSRRFAVDCLDVVHAGFLKGYVENLVLPVSKSFASAVAKHRKVLASGVGFAPGFDANPWKDIANRLRPGR